MKRITVNFDLDGTLADLYGVPCWLDSLRKSDPTPYQVAKPLVNMSLLARYIHKAQAKGIKVQVISWLSKNGTCEYNEKVAEVKKEWLKKHLPSVHFDNINIVKYGTPKNLYTEPQDFNILFDDEAPNRTEWVGKAYKETEIFETLKRL